MKWILHTFNHFVQVLIRAIWVHELVYKQKSTGKGDYRGIGDMRMYVKELFCKQPKFNQKKTTQIQAIRKRSWIRKRNGIG